MTPALSFVMQSHFSVIFFFSPEGDV